MIELSAMNKKLVVINSITGELGGSCEDLELVSDIAGFRKKIARQGFSYRFVFSESLADLPDQDWADFLDLFASYVQLSSGLPKPPLNEDWCEHSSLSFLAQPQATLTRQSSIRLDAPDFSPNFSIIVPFRNREETLRPMLLQLTKLADIERAEVILVDDASKIPLEDSLGEVLMQMPYQWKILKLSPSKIFRAGIARNAGALAAKSENLVFVDSDFILPKDFLIKVRHGFEAADLLQAKRWQIWRDEWNGHSAPLPIGRREPNPFWNDFQNSDQDWNSTPQSWKYVSSFCLAVKKNKFMELGGFRSWYSNYGSEDTDFGLRCHRAGMKFMKLDTDVHHLSNQTFLEWQSSRSSNRAKLKRSARKFLMINQTLESLDWLTYMMFD